MQAAITTCAQMPCSRLSKCYRLSGICRATATVCRHSVVTDLESGVIFHRLKETRAINAGLNPQVTADDKSATATVQAVSAASAVTQAEGTSPSTPSAAPCSWSR